MSQYLVIARDQDAPEFHLLQWDDVTEWLRENVDDNTRFIDPDDAAAVLKFLPLRFPPHAVLIIEVERVVVPEPVKVVKEWRLPL